MRFTRDIKDFIIDKICDGMHIATICKNYPDKVPHVKSVLRKCSMLGDDPEFAAEVSEAWTVYYMVKTAEIDELTSKSALELYPTLDININPNAPKDGWKQAEATRRARLDALKFDLGKLAPVFSKRFDKATSIEISGKIDSTHRLEQAPIVHTINYSDIKEIEDNDI